MHIDTENHSKYPLRTCKFQNFLGRHPDPPRLSCYAAELLLATIAWPLDQAIIYKINNYKVIPIQHLL